MTFGDNASSENQNPVTVSASEALAPLQDGRELIIEALCLGDHFTARRQGGELVVGGVWGDDLGADAQRVREALEPLTDFDFHVEGVATRDAVLLTDLLEWNGADWTPRPLRERLAELGEISPVALMPERTTTDMLFVGQAFLDHLRARGAAGAVVKDPDAPRSAGTTGWRVVAWE
jgi:ATP-dependent DNA ligase